MKETGKKEYTEYRFHKKDWLWFGGEYVLLFCLVDWLCYRSWWLIIPAIPLGVWYRRLWCRRKKEKRKKIIYYHFQDVLHGFQTALGAGYSMERAVGECRKELEQIYGADDDLRNELYYMEQQLQVGASLEQLFLDLGKRTQIEDIMNFGEIFLIARRSGGNLGNIIRKMDRVIGEKIRVAREIDVAVAGKKTEQAVMSLMPAMMILYMNLTSPGFLDILYHNLAGEIMMTICLGIYGCSFYLGRKIVRIEI